MDRCAERLQHCVVVCAEIVEAFGVAADDPVNRGAAAVRAADDVGYRHREGVRLID